MLAVPEIMIFRFLSGLCFAVACIPCKILKQVFFFEKLLKIPPKKVPQKVHFWRFWRVFCTPWELSGSRGASEYTCSRFSSVMGRISRKNRNNSIQKLPREPPNGSNTAHCPEFVQNFWRGGTQACLLNKCTKAMWSKFEHNASCLFHFALCILVTLCSHAPAHGFRITFTFFRHLYQLASWLA